MQKKKIHIIYTMNERPTSRGYRAKNVEESVY